MLEDVIYLDNAAATRLDERVLEAMKPYLFDLYAVAKMGVITLTEVIAAEVKGTGVTANVLLPSIIDTPANRKMMSSADETKWVPPAHIAETMRFLCSDAAGSINGDRIPIYGAV